MISNDFQKCMGLFKKCLEELPEGSSVYWNQNKWTSVIENGKYKQSIKKSILNTKSCREKLERTLLYSDLKMEFSKIQIIFNLKTIQEPLFDQFIETYFYLSQKVKFEEKYFVDLCDILQQHISKEYFKKLYFFTPIYNFDTHFQEIEIDEFKIIKILPTHFDRISSINLHIGENAPRIDCYPIEQLKYVLSFYMEDNAGYFNPEKISSNFLHALRLTKPNSIYFGKFYGYHPLHWQGYDTPGYTEDTKLLTTTYLLKQEDISSLKDKLRLLKKLQTDFEVESIRYLMYSIRRFCYIYDIYDNGIVEDNITDLIISLEGLLNDQPYEITDKTSLRACVILEEDDERKRDCQKFIKKCYGIRSEIVHAKKRTTTVKEIKEVLSDIEINKIISNEKIKKLLTTDEINKILAKDFKKILSKEEINQILPDEFKKTLGDAEIKNRLENYVRKAISLILFLHLKYKTQKNVLSKIDDFILNRSENPLLPTNSPIHVD